MTTTEGHERLGRARDRFAQVAKERGVEEPQPKRHRPEGEGGQPLAPPASSNNREGGGSSSGSALPPPPSPPPLEPPLLEKRGLEHDTEVTDATFERQGETNRRRSILKGLKPATAVAAVKAQLTLKWDWWMCSQFSPKQKVAVEADG